MYRLFAAALLVVGLVLSWSTPSVAQSATIDAESVPVVRVDLQGPFGPYGNVESATSVVEHGTGTVDLQSVTIDDGEVRVLVPAATPVISAQPRVDALPAVAAIENGVVTGAASAELEPALARTLASADLRDYVRTTPGSAPVVVDVRYGEPVTAADYLIVTESDPDAEVRVQALDAAGDVIVDAPTAVLLEGAGWSTGFAPADQTPAQPVRLVVVDVGRLLGSSGHDSLHGIRITAEAGADTKVLVGQALPMVDSGASSAPAPADLDVVAGVYQGVDGGNRCEGAPEALRAEGEDRLTYCYTVTNTGGYALNGLVVDDPELSGLVQTVGGTPERLEPGESARFFIESTPPADSADGVVDRTSVAMASISAYTDAGDEVAASAEAVVQLGDVTPRPGVALSVTAYAGADGGARCPGSDRAEVATGRAVTYCYRVTNTGNTALGSVALIGTPQDPVATGGNGLLGPGATRTFHVEVAAPDTAVDDVLVTATVRANPVSTDGGDLTGVNDVSAHGGTQLQAPLTSTLDPTLAAMVRANQSASAPDQLAFTGWESWLLAVAGIGLVAGGWAVIRERGLRRPVPVRVDRPGSAPRH